MRYSVRHKDEDGEINHVQFDVSEVPSQHIVLLGAGILFANEADGGVWCVYDDSNTPLSQGAHIAEDYKDDPALRSSEPTSFFDVEF